VVVSRHHVASSWIPLVRVISPTTRIVFDTVDLHFLREQREAEVAGKKALLRCALATQRREFDNIAAADVTWVVSPVEKALLSTQLPAAHVQVVANLHDIRAEAASDRGRAGMLFVGGGNHPPNIDAVRWLVTDIHPLVRKHLPGSLLHIVGEGIEDRIPGTPGMREGIVFHGHVPDLTTLLSTMRVGLAPLRFGAGVKGKVNQYMAHGLPTVATDCAVEGMHLTHGHDVMVANDPAAFARAVLELHEDRDAWTRLSTHGLANVRRHFSLASADTAFAATFSNATTRED
jgi:glycosyltransferase involved in cell wall biosynthesis